MDEARDIFESDPTDISGVLLVDGGECPYDVKAIIGLRKKYGLPGNEGIVEQLERIGAPQHEIDSVFLPGKSDARGPRT